MRIGKFLILIPILLGIGVTVVIFSLEKYDSVYKQYYTETLFVGTVMGTDNGCSADGTCSIIINEKPVSYIYGWGGCEKNMGGVYLKNIEPFYIPSVDSRELKGRLVIVYARKITAFRNAVNKMPLVNGEVTLCGSKSYFIREI